MSENIDTVKDVLSHKLHWRKLDFIEPLLIERDRLVYAQYLTRPLADADDLRFLYTLPRGESLAIFAEREPWESQNLGYSVAQLRGMYLLESPYVRPKMNYAPALRAFIAEVEAQNVRYLWTAADARDASFLAALASCRFTLIGSCVYYYRSLYDFAFPEQRHCRVATADDIPSLGQAAQQNINPYDRFHADPVFAPSDVARLMYAWAENAVLGRNADVTIVPDVMAPTTFSSARFYQSNWADWGLRVAELVSGPPTSDVPTLEMQAAIEMLSRMRALGIDHVYSTTQLANRNEIRLLEDLGFRFGRVEHIYSLELG